MSGHGLAIAEDGQPVGNVADLFHAVRDENDELAFGGEFACQPEQPVGLAGGQGGGCLIENEDCGIAGETFGDLDDLPFRQCQPAHFLVGCDTREFVFLEQRQCPAAHFAAADSADG